MSEEVQGHSRLYLGQPSLYETVSKNKLIKLTSLLTYLNPLIQKKERKEKNEREKKEKEKRKGMQVLCLG